jgi:hypothetical protein
MISSLGNTSRPWPETTAYDWLVKAAHAKMMGPRVRQTLKNANKTKYYDAVMKRISKIKKDYL